MVIYVSHPFQGNPTNTMKVADYVRKLLNSESGENTFVSPIHALGYLWEDVSYQKGLDMCLDLLGKCDAIIMCGDWKDSIGCNTEFAYAKAKDMDIYYYIGGVILDKAY